MRFDPELAEKWKAIEQAHYKIEEPNSLDSFNNLKYAIRNHPILSKLEKPYYFDGELQRTLLNPLLFENSLNDKQFDELSDELVRLIKENVKPEFIKNYYSTLQSSVSRLEKIIKRHKLLIEKIKAMYSN
jgi:predicted 2-oxoglutarate/Fe(II)-dependent dioxygenase YbiX